MYSRRSRLLFFFSLCLVSCCAQKPVRSHEPAMFSPAALDSLKLKYAQNKHYPPAFEEQVLIALSYFPELCTTRITFRERPRHGTAITRSTWSSVLLPAGSRKYVITISDAVEPTLQPLLLSNLPFNAQIGVIGHELSHVLQYERMSTSGLLGYAAGNLSARYVDRFEFAADGICIAHGLGYQLLQWSSFVREKMNTVNWRGPDFVHRQHSRERYMNPSTILEKIKTDSLYSGLR